MVVIAGLEEGLFPHSRVGEDERGARGRTPAVLRRHDARAVAARPHQRRATAGVRRVSVDRAVPLPGRDPGRARRAHRADVELTYQSAFSHSHYEFRTNPYGRKGRGRAREKEATYAYEHEDQSATGVRTGHAGAPRAVRRRHRHRRRGAQRRLEGHRALQLVGVKKLLAKYAKLEPA